MAGVHPVDAAGRVLPHAWWPSDRQAPGELEFVRRFCNSINRENGAERFDSPASLDHWLIGEAAAPVAATRAQLARLIDLRESMQALIVANSTEVQAARGWADLGGVAGDVRFGLETDGGSIAIAPRGRPFEALVGRLALAIVDAQRDGRWLRLKACQHCGWVVFDPSKNRSARWCSMSACGGRHNARQYRLRLGPRSAGANNP
jgi:predicted RNA-binding Zn ribbon-like protein